MPIFKLLAYNLPIYMDINQSIFKAYDIRGIYPSEINEEAAEKIGQAFVVYLGRKTGKDSPAIAVAHDLRESSPSLSEAFIKGVLKQGGNVYDICKASTPFLYFVLQNIPADGGAMITASHNPAEHNGIKLRGPGGEAIYIENGLKDIQAIASGGIPQAAKEGEMLPANDLSENYISFLANSAAAGKLKIAIDAVGGSTTLYLDRLLKHFPQVEYAPFYFTPDAKFHARHPNPLLPETQEAVKKELAKGGYNFGVIFDGDGDRVLFLDEQGQAVNPEFIFLLFARDSLQGAEKGVYALPLDTTKSVREHITNHGWKVAPTRRGYAFVKAVMEKEHSPFSVEKSGHFFFKEFKYNDSGLLAFLKLAHLLSEARQPLSQIVRSFSNYYTTGEVNFHTNDPTAMLQKLERHFKEGTRSNLDGVMVEFPDWWFNIRPSNTEPVVRLVLEAKTKELFEQKLQEIKTLLAEK